MSPAPFDRGDGHLLAIKAAGGRRIIPALVQMTSFPADFGMSVETCVKPPWVDVGEDGHLLRDGRWPDAIIAALSKDEPDAHATNPDVHPGLFPKRQSASSDGKHRASTGAAFSFNPGPA